MDSVPKRISIVFTACISLLVMTTAHAHVKWFFPYDISTPPLGIGEIITKEFIYLFLVSVVSTYAFFWVDRYCYHRHFLNEKLASLTINPTQSLWILRGAIAVFFVALFLFGINDQAFYLTPELKTDNAVVPWIQLALAACAIYRRTVPLVGIGIILLYVIGISNYGIFHMLDYLIFLGTACFFLFSNLDEKKWLMPRYVILFASTGLTLLWASIEKWGFPHWSYDMLAADPSLLMGMSPYFYMLFAGFVEFNITFLLLSSASVFVRILALGLNTVFILAILKFGLVDAVGHLMIIAILVVLMARGPTSARFFMVLENKSLWTEAYFMTGLYILALNIVFVAYYGIYYLSR